MRLVWIWKIVLALPHGLNGHHGEVAKKPTRNASKKGTETAWTSFKNCRKIVNPCKSQNIFIVESWIHLTTNFRAQGHAMAKVTESEEDKECSCSPEWGQWSMWSRLVR